MLAEQIAEPNLELVILTMVTGVVGVLVQYLHPLFLPAMVVLVLLRPMLAIKHNQMAPSNVTVHALQLRLPLPHQLLVVGKLRAVILAGILIRGVLVLFNVMVLQIKQLAVVPMVQHLLSELVMAMLVQGRLHRRTLVVKPTLGALARFNVTGRVMVLLARLRQSVRVLHRQRVLRGTALEGPSPCRGIVMLLSRGHRPILLHVP